MAITRVLAHSAILFIVLKKKWFGFNNQFRGGKTPSMVVAKQLSCEQQQHNCYGNNCDA
jgi:hypothetical protein